MRVGDRGTETHYVHPDPSPFHPFHILSSPTPPTPLSQCKNAPQLHCAFVHYSTPLLSRHMQTARVEEVDLQRAWRTAVGQGGNRCHHLSVGLCLELVVMGGCGVPVRQMRVLFRSEMSSLWVLVRVQGWQEGMRVGGWRLGMRQSPACTPPSDSMYNLSPIYWVYKASHPQPAVLAQLPIPQL